MSMENTDNYQYLDNIELPKDLRELTITQMPEVCQDLRKFLLQCVSKSGGHFAAGLGVIELTTALHYVFNTPEDKLLWDVGHQGYPHKILTGRKHLMESIRTRGGLGPFRGRRACP